MKTYPLTTLILCPYKSALHNLFVGTPQRCDGINCMCFVEDVAGVSGHCGLINVTSIDAINVTIVGEPV